MISLYLSRDTFDMNCNTASAWSLTDGVKYEMNNTAFA